MGVWNMAEGTVKKSREVLDKKKLPEALIGQRLLRSRQRLTHIPLQLLAELVPTSSFQLLPITHFVPRQHGQPRKRLRQKRRYP